MASVCSFVRLIVIWSAPAETEEKTNGADVTPREAAVGPTGRTEAIVTGL